MTIEELAIQEHAVAFAIANKKEIAEALTDNSIFPLTNFQYQYLWLVHQVLAKQSHPEISLSQLQKMNNV